MRIVVSGTHASGKSTLISDFTLKHPEFTVVPDPFDLLDEADDIPSAQLFAAQLAISADSLIHEAQESHLIAERCPLDFLAYLEALSGLRGTVLDEDFLRRAIELTGAALSTVDLLVVLPLAPNDQIYVDADEFPELRMAMDEVLRRLLSEADIVGDDLAVVELEGDPQTRLGKLEALYARESY